MHLRVGRTRRNKEWFGGNSFPWGKSSFQACFSTGDSRPEPKLWAESARMIPHAAPLGITVCCNATLVPGLRRQKPSFYDQPAAIFANQNFQKKKSEFLFTFVGTQICQTRRITRGKWIFRSLQRLLSRMNIFLFLLFKILVVSSVNFSSFQENTNFVHTVDEIWEVLKWNVDFYS